MRAMPMTAICSVNLLAAGRKMNVAICNLGGVSESVVSRARSETDQAYQSAGVQIAWRTCEEFTAGASNQSAPWFVIRLRNDKPPGRPVPRRRMSWGRPSRKIAAALWGTRIPGSPGHRTVA
jgi:hypothetical protein